jgi:hypothetical protein
LRNAGRTTLFTQATDVDLEVLVADRDMQTIADMQQLRRLARQIIDRNLAAFDRFFRNRARLEKTRGP